MLQETVVFRQPVFRCPTLIYPSEVVLMGEQVALAPKGHTTHSPTPI